MLSPIPPGKNVPDTSLAAAPSLLSLFQEEPDSRHRIVL